VLVGLGLIVAYVAICLAPLVVVALGSRQAGRPFLVEFSVALGYVGLVMLALQFAMVSRSRWLAAPFGVDILQRFHGEVSFVALAFVLAHPALLVVQNARVYLPLFDLGTSPWRARLGIAAVAVLLVVVLLSVGRRALRLSYEMWQATHRFLSVGVIVLGLAHMIGVNRFTSEAGGRAVVAAVAVVVLGLLVWSRMIEPRLFLLRPWRVVELVRERGGAITLVLHPEGHTGWSFMPGQFAWLALGRSPLRRTAQHPFSLSSPGDVQPGGNVGMTIKGLGDWTHGTGLIEPGSRVYLDGPHGSFSIDLQQGPGYVLIGGGVGITPLYSMIGTMYQREDTRRVVLVYASPNWEAVTFRDQLEELRGRMPNLEVVYLLKDPPPGWTGETGRVTAELLNRHLPRNYESFEYFVCAGEAMMDTVEQTLLAIGVPGYRIHTERFAVV
jgi:predicted ferric reductase